MLRVDGFTVVIFFPPREHGPAHVHIRHADGELIVELAPVRIVEGWMPRITGRTAVRIVEAHRDHLLSEWEKLHG